MMKRIWLAVIVAACAADTPEDGEHDEFLRDDAKEDSVWFIEDHSWEAEAVLRLVNSASFDTLHDEIGISSMPARSIANAPKPITSLTNLDDLAWVGPLTFQRLRSEAVERGYGPKLAEEYPPAGEEAAIDDTIKAMGEIMQKRSPSGHMHRGQHAKAHGCVAGTFRVEAGVPAALRAGVFAQAGEYRSWVRFSNGDSLVKADSEKDVRGLAIKLMGVTGPKVLPEESDATTQDFLLINHPTLMTRNTLRYAELAKRAASGNQFSIILFFLSLNPADWELRSLRNLLAMVSHETPSPLEVRYFSTTPYLLGDNAVKYSARPCQTGSTIPVSAPADYLRQALATYLGTRDACFEFMVQLQTDPKAMPIEDPTIEWKEDQSQFVKVATLTIARQQFDTSEQNTFCENLSFTPWHSLEVHRPLGGINRARRAVYRAITVLRHMRNGAAVSEPR